MNEVNLKEAKLIKWSALLALLLLLMAQIKHTMYVYNATSHYQDPWFAWCFAIGVDIGIFIFTYGGWKRTAILYLIGTYALNLVYQYWTDESWSGSLVQLFLSGSIYLFSHFFFQKRKEETAGEPQQSTEEERLNAAFKAGVRFEPQPHLCPECGVPFPDTKKLNGHISGHKQISKWFPEKYGDWELENEQRASLVDQLNINRSIKLNHYENGSLIS